MLPIRLKTYVKDIKASLVDLDDDIEQIHGFLAEAKRSGRRIWILGNGGSLALAQHLAQDIVKLAGARAHAVNCPSVITAFANDDGFEYSFFNFIHKMADPEDPILIFSCSGKSRNYIEFVSGFPDMRNPLLAVVGTDGGFLKNKSTVSIHVKSNDYQICETAFSIIADILVKSLAGVK